MDCLAVLTRDENQVGCSGVNNSENWWLLRAKAQICRAVDGAHLLVTVYSSFDNKGSHTIRIIVRLQFKPPPPDLTSNNLVSFLDFRAEIVLKGAKIPESR